MRKLLMLGLLVTLLGLIVPVPSTLADEPDQANEPITLISAGPISSELSMTAEKAQVEDDTFANTLGADPLDQELDGATPNGIIGGDNRERVWTTTDNPYRAVVHLEITRADGKLDFCTGFFVRPDTIMTAGHCVYQYDSAGNPLAERGWVNQITVIPARSWQWENGQRVVKMPFGQDNAARFITNTAWAGSQHPGTHDHDFGFVVLPDRTLFDGMKGTNGGINTLFRLQDAVLSPGHGITISGYPCDKSWFVEFVRDKNCGHPENPPMDAQGNRIYPTGLWEMWTDTATISSVTPSNNNPLQYRTSVDTMPGQDGGPCWYTEQGPAGPTYVAVGVYAEETSTSNNCVAFRTATISGQVTDGIPNDPHDTRYDPDYDYHYVKHSHPLADVWVTLHKTTNNDMVAATHTDNNGDYTFTGLLGGQDYRVRITLTDGGADFTSGSVLRFSRLPTMNIIDGSVSTVPPDQPVYLEVPVSVRFAQQPDRDIHFSRRFVSVESGATTNVAETNPARDRLSDLALLYTYTHDAVRYIESTLGLSLRASPLMVKGYSTAATMPSGCVDRSGNGVSCYNSANVTLYLSVDGANNDSNYSERGEKSQIRFTTYHEIGHYLLNQTKGLPPVSGVWSDDPACDQARGGFYHAGFCDSTTAASFLEGFANFFVSVVKAHTNHYYPARTAPDRPYDDPASKFTLEYSIWSGLLWGNDKNKQELKAWEFEGEQDSAGNLVINPATGFPKRVVEFEEWAVAGLLWDLIDSSEGSKQVQYTDNVQVPASNLLQAMLVRNGQLPLHDVPDLHKILKQDQDSTLRAAFDGDADGDGVQDLDEIFVAHGFFDSPGTNVGATGGTEPVWDGDVSKIGFGGRQLSEYERKGLWCDDPTANINDPEHCDQKWVHVPQRY